MKKKTIVITGSTRGIGLGLTKEFLALGHKLVINGRSRDIVNRVVEELKKVYPDVIGVAGSVAEEQTHLDLIEEAVKEFGAIDIWINNAGVPQPHESFAELDSSQIHQVVEVNITGSLIGTKVAAKFMEDQGHGRIFNMEGFGSDGRMMNKLSLYGTTKRAINYFTKSLAKELADSQVKMGVIQPGMVRTDFLSTSMDSGTEEEKKQFKKVYDILAEDVGVVTKALAPRILACTKNYERVEFLSKMQLMGRIFKMILTR
jgi:NAD(P)-dependent dehydrogenase (short-subunit alcohol dehydrogenase family)